MRKQTSTKQSRYAFGLTAAAVSLLVAGCGGSDGPAAKTCDDGLKASFKPDGVTTVLRVKAFAQGDELKLENSTAPVAPATFQRAPVDVCLVKLLVGPGKAGPAGAPSTKAGIGIEVWLPMAPAGAAQVWNDVIRAYGSGGFAGGFHADTTRLDRGNTTSANATFGNVVGALAKGYASSTSDHGATGVSNGSFTLNEDGSINTVLWQDFAERSMLEQAEKTKALVSHFYGKAHKYAYFDGYSTGGRQAYKLAQKYPQAYDGILAGAPAFNWTKFITAELYPQVVMQRELGAPLSTAKLHATSAAASAACGGSALGFQLDPLACRYDPTKDAARLCAGEVGNGVTGASNNVSTCLRNVEAVAINKIWYGMTRDGSAPDPAADNGTSLASLSANHVWFGLTRGSNLTALGGATPFAIASTTVALGLLDPSYAQATPAGVLTNAAGANLGQDRWKTLSYADLGRAFDQNLALQPAFSFINTDNADLSGLRDRGAKVISYHGLNDQLIMPQGSIQYFERVAVAMGGTAEVQKFNRLYLIPAYGHDGGTFTVTGAIDPATEQLISLAKTPLPQNSTGRDELFTALRNWVEKGQAPDRIDVASSNNSVTMPICIYPQRVVQTGTVATAASSYACR